MISYCTKTSGTEWRPDWWTYGRGTLLLTRRRSYLDLTLADSITGLSNVSGHQIDFRDIMLTRQPQTSSRVRRRRPPRLQNRLPPHRLCPRLPQRAAMRRRDPKVWSSEKRHLLHLESAAPRPGLRRDEEGDRELICANGTRLY